MKRTMNKWKVVAAVCCWLVLVGFLGWVGGVIAQEFDPYLLPQARMTAPINWVLFPEAVQEAKKEYDEGVAKAKAEYEKAVAEVSTPLVSALAVAQKEATQEGNLELAIALRDAKNAVEVGDTAPDRSAVRKLMIGKWKYSDPGGNFYLVFKEGDSVQQLAISGTVLITGRWKITDEGVEITWPLDIRSDLVPGAKYWHFLPYPIKTRLTVGDSWLGRGTFRSQRVK